MRTSIDIPDHLMQKAKKVAAQRKTTLKTLMVDALERSLKEPPAAFKLREASVGDGPAVSNEQINAAIDETRTGIFNP